MTEIWIAYRPYVLLISAAIIIAVVSRMFFSKFLKYKKRTTLLHMIIYSANSIWMAIVAYNLLNPLSRERIIEAAILLLTLGIPVLWVINALYHTRGKQKYKKIYLIFIAPLFCFLLIILTNNFHNYLWQKSNETGSANIVHWLIVLYEVGFVVGGTVLFLKNLGMPFYIFRWQTFSMFIAALLPLGIIFFTKIRYYFDPMKFFLLPLCYFISTWMIRLTRLGFTEKDIIAISRASFFENINNAIIMLDHKNMIIDSNPNAGALTGRHGRGSHHQALEEVLPELVEYIDRITVKGEALKFITLEHAGKTRYYEIDVSFFVDMDGQLISRIVILQDISERKEAEEALRKSEEKFRNIIKQSIDGIIIIDEEGMISEWNNGMEKITGIKREVIVSKPSWVIYNTYLFPYQSGFNKEKITEEKILMSLKTGNVEWFNKFSETYLTHTDGTIRTIQQQAFPIKTSKGISLGSIIRDITENKQLETERIKSGKLESLGILAGGIAHDFNNILTAVIGNLSLAKVVGKDDKLFKLLTEAESASSQAKDLTQQLLTFSKGGSPIRKTTSIITVIKNAASFSLRRSNAKYEIIAGRDTWPVDVDIGQMNQVVSNLIINADQAMPEGGVIRISISNVHLKKGEIFPLKAGKYVKISIMDEGDGIPPDNLAKIYDPYFTTKEKGSGLGLAITYSIIKKHTGHITVDSIEGVGTNFTIYLRASEEPIIEYNTKKNPDKSFSAKILIMDDEPAVRNILQQMLEMLNHSAETTTDGNEAITAYKKALDQQECFDLVIMDLTVPGGMGGKDTIIKLLEIDPEVKAVVSSGYSNDPIIAEFKKYGFKGFLLKPYKLSELEAVLINILLE